jgi:hypothetical protein
MAIMTNRIVNMPRSGKDTPSRDDKVEVALTKAEKTQLRVKAARQNLTMSEYIRKLVFGDEETVPA